MLLNRSLSSAQAGLRGKTGPSTEGDEERRRRERASEKLKQLELQMSSRPLLANSLSPVGLDTDSTWMVKPPSGPWKKLTKEEVRVG